jgi:flavin-dependent dehydrogenase
MSAELSTDVLVAGAGPAGAVTATALARQGMRVLLAGGQLTSGTCDYDLMVSGAALQGLTELGVTDALPLRPIDTIALRLGTSPGREIADASSASCDAITFRRTLCRAAVTAGAEHVQGTVTAVSRDDAGVSHAVIDGRTVTARHVVIATGAAGELTRAAGTAPGDDQRAVGLAWAQRFHGIEGFGPAMLLAMSAPSTIDPGEQPTCVWALPGAGDTITVGVARMGDRGRGGPGDLADLARRFMADYGADLTGLHQASQAFSGVLYTGYAPGLLANADHLLVGDAAGLVNPFTGEGLSYAIQSGILAAHAICVQFTDPDAARRAYARTARRAFVGYFETARHGARRYHLAWRVLAAATVGDHPFFAKARRAILLPEGLTGLTGSDSVRISGQDAMHTEPFLIACDEAAVTTIRKEWPFLARLMMGGEPTAHHGVRPALLFLAGLLAEGKPPDITLAIPAAAIELATLGALAFLGTAAPAHDGRGVDWAGATTILAGDFLFAQAYRLVAESAPEISWSFADWMMELATLRAMPDSGSQLGAEETFAALFEFPARIGALLGGCSPRIVQALREYGWHAGRAFLHAEDLLTLRGERSRLDSTREFMISARISAVHDASDSGEVEAVKACSAALEGAMDAISQVPHPVSVRILEQFVRTVALPINHE